MPNASFDIIARDDLTRDQRHTLMVEANRAYALGDEDRLRWVLQAWERSPEAVQDLNVLIADEEFLPGGTRHGLQERLLVLLVDTCGRGSVGRVYLQGDLKICHDTGGATR